MKKRTLLSPERCAVLLRALGDPDRLRIVEALRERPYAVSKLASKLGLEVANVSHHLGVLRRAELVVARREGKQIIYAMPDEICDGESDEGQHLNLGCCRLEMPRA